MKISNFQIDFVRSDRGLIGFARFTLDNKIRFQRVAVFHRLIGGIRLSWPEKDTGNKRIKLAHPINEEIQTLIESQVLELIKEQQKIQGVDHAIG